MASLQDFVWQSEDELKEKKSPLLRNALEPLQYVTKDSGERKIFDSGMQRDTNTGKMQPDLALDGPMFLRWVALMTRGAVKYQRRNWMKASGPEELERFRESAVRHFVQWYYGLNPEEDHGAALFFNVNGAEYVRSLRAKDVEAPSDEEFEAIRAKVEKEGDFHGHTGPHPPPPALLVHPSICPYCRVETEEVVDKTMNQDGTEILSPKIVDSTGTTLFKERVSQGVRHVFYRGRSGHFYVHVYEFETGKKLCESIFTYLFDAEEDYKKDWQLDH